MAGNPKVSLDTWFYIAAGTLLVIILGTWYIGRGMVQRSEGRDVQAILEKTNVADDESYRRQARNYVAEQARNRNMTPAQRREAEQIFFEAFRNHMTIWMDDRLEGASDAETRQKQRESWRAHRARFEAMMGD
ncbi:MAG: hypothetical protein JJU11_15155 [Candidatus Sumerlaeia bacterium]|nr:hypothetical protein [Candidatus Sumerlaeia bacterium]